METRENTTATAGMATRTLSVLRRGVRLVFRVTLTGAVIAGAAFAVQFGTTELTRRADAAPAPEAAPAIPVSAYPLRMEAGYDVRRAFVGQVEPQKTVSLSFELAGRLAEIAVEEGDTVTAGQILARQDLALLEAERAQLIASKEATEAQLLFAEQTVSRNETLSARGFATQAGLDGAVAQRNELIARIAEVDAGLANVDIRIGKAQIVAPFDGRVTTRSVDGGESLSPGQSILGLVELRTPLVRVGVPLDLDQDKLMDARIELAGTAYPARLVTLRPDIDPVTRTRTAIFEIDSDAPPAFGQTARLMLTDRIDARGLWVPLTALKEGVRGQWTLLTVDPAGTVRSASVEILHAESTRVFVRGAFPDGTLLIEQGPQRVTVGQQVVASMSE